ncbi:MAG: DUF1015 domain-containing protein [Oscillospiraceae bacterium]|nr:DUF1015 domain-containing protein [Oscillospiraceae bacterium]
MAEIKAFKGLRYSAFAGDLAELCCPPYDIINEEQRMALLETNENNIIRLELPQAVGVESEEGYKEARSCLNKMLMNGVLADDRGENIYAYEFSFEYENATRSVKGFIALVKLEDFDKGIILPHEETLSKAKTDRFNLMVATGCNFSQIYSLYSDEDNSVQALLDGATTGEPDGMFTDSDSVTHKLWRVWDDAVIAGISAKMTNKKIFIADGHHRYETALNYLQYVRENKSNMGSAAFVPMMLVNLENPGLTVLPTHRIVRDLAHYNYDEVITRCAEYFDITDNLTLENSLKGSLAVCKTGKNAFVLYNGDGNYAVLSLKNNSVMASLLPEAHDCLRNLDVSVLHSLILERLFGIDKENMAQQINLTYTRSIYEAVTAVDEKKANCCFLLNPTRVSEIRNVALTGGKMPQKSTYFYPKLTTGLVMNRIFK